MYYCHYSFSSGVWLMLEWEKNGEIGIIHRLVVSSVVVVVVVT